MRSAGDGCSEQSRASIGCRDQLEALRRLAENCLTVRRLILILGLMTSDEAHHHPFRTHLHDPFLLVPPPVLPLKSEPRVSAQFQDPNLPVLPVPPQFMSPRATYRRCTLERNPHQVQVP